MTPSINETEQAFIKFATSLLNLNHQQEEKNVLKYGVPDILLQILDKVGPQSCSVASILLETLSSLKEDTKFIIDSAGIPVIYRTLQYHNNDNRVVLFGCKILSSVGSAHKANAAVGRAISCLSEVLRNFDKEVSLSCVAQVFSTLSAFARFSDANKLLIALGSIPQEAIKVIDLRVKFDLIGTQLLGSCAAMVANVSYKQVAAAQALLESGLVTVMMQKATEIMSSTFQTNDTDSQEDIEKVLIAIANLSNSDENCSTMCSIENSARFVIDAVQQSDDANVIRYAALACASMSFKCKYAKRSFCHANAIEALIDVILRFGLHNETNEDKEELRAAEAATKALCTICTDKAALRIIEHNFQDFESLIQLYLQTESDEVLLGGSMFISLLLPSSQVRTILATEGRKSFIENKGGEEVIQRCFNSVYFCDESLCPSWFLVSVALFFKDCVEEAEDARQITNYFNHSDLYTSIDICS